jgi:hypothetical protein
MLVTKMKNNFFIGGAGNKQGTFLQSGDDDYYASL